MNDLSSLLQNAIHFAIRSLFSGFIGFGNLCIGNGGFGGQSATAHVACGGLFLADCSSKVTFDETSDSKSGSSIGGLSVVAMLSVGNVKSAFSSSLAFFGGGDGGGGEVLDDGSIIVAVPEGKYKIN